MHSAKDHDLDTSTKGATGKEKCYIHAEKIYIIFFILKNVIFMLFFIINYIINLMFNS